MNEDPIHLVVWVTSRCNLQCPKCNEIDAMEASPDYEMPWSEFEYLVRQSLDRGIHYATVELTGGEPTLWLHFAEALELLRDSGVTDWATFWTNGRDAKTVAEIARRYAPVYGVSATQATPKQLETHRSINPNILVNSAPHKTTPQYSLPDTHPAVCVVSGNRLGVAVLQLGYFDRRVYHCCTARSLGGSAYSVPFDEDFVAHYRQQPRDQEICGRCLCNDRVWRQVLQ